MSERQTKTIEIGKGVRYAKVADRLMEFHKDNPECSTETSCEFKEGWAIFTARVTTKKGVFTGHSMGKVSSRQKQFEKQESIAVGRALGFAGYLASGAIATYEEMAGVVTAPQFTSLRLKYAEVYAASLAGMPRLDQQQAFNRWAKAQIGEDTDYNERANWEPEWFQTCWRALTGVSADVPFEE